MDRVWVGGNGNWSDITHWSATNGGLGGASIPMAGVNVWFTNLGFPILIGASRKRFLGELINAKDPNDREAATIALTTELARLKVWGVRTHAVKAHQDAISVIERMRK
jgi:dihydropteroate synthase